MKKNIIEIEAVKVTEWLKWYYLSQTLSDPQGHLSEPPFFLQSKFYSCFICDLDKLLFPKFWQVKYLITSRLWKLQEWFLVNPFNIEIYGKWFYYRNAEKNHKQKDSLQNVGNYSPLLLPFL